MQCVMTIRSRITTGALTLTLAALAGLAWRGATDDALPKPRVPHQVCTLQDKRIDESSGLAASRRYPDLIWTHNDSGDTARAFLIDHKGQTRAVVNLIGAEAIDWEDMEVVGEGAAAWVYTGDIGDNFERRPNVVVYRFHEPDLATALQPQTSNEKVTRISPVVNMLCQKVTLTYPDRAHNAESLIVTPAGDIIIVSKDANGSQIFKSPQPFSDCAAMVLQQVGSYKFTGASKWSPLATGADLSPDGKHVVVTTYTDVFEWDVPAENPWATLWQNKPRISALPQMKQAESICYTNDSRNLLVGSEGTNAPIFELDDEP